MTPFPTNSPPRSIVARWLVAAFLPLAGLGHGALPLHAMQAQSPVPLRFNAASLKLAADQDRLETRPKRSVGRLRWTSYLLNLVSFAYGMEWWRIAEVPGLNTIYVLEATTPPGTTLEQTRLMLQNLLAERFQLQVHRASRNISEGYSLTLAKGGPKLQPAKPPAGTGTGEFDDGYVTGNLSDADTLLIRGHYASIPQLAEYLQRSLATSVLDNTDLSGRYDFELLCGAEGGHGSPNLLAGCLNRVGLTLQRYKGPVEFLVIDRLGKLIEN